MQKHYGQNIYYLTYDNMAYVDILIRNLKYGIVQKIYFKIQEKK